MKTLATAFSAVVLAVSLSSCSFLTEKYAQNEKASAAFLADNKTAPAKMNIEGLWYSPQWGIVLLNQEGSKLDGVFQDYYAVKGVVSGKTAYITLTDDDWTEYTAILKYKNGEELVGAYSSYVPLNEKHQHDLVLKRIDR